MIPAQKASTGGSAPDAFQQEAERLQDLMQDKGELLLRVQTLRQGLSDWRTKLNDQVRDYQEEMGSLNTTLKTEVSQLRSEFNQLRDTLRQQMELTVSLANGEKKTDAASTVPQKQF
ncbi:hypothetical protein WJX79_004689 [Trebouxia sp. C0005]|nr:MAG: hypothetical protein FRX49_07510 [Trebouxia sp. A1-2]